MWITPLWPQGYCSAQESRPRPSIIVIAGTNVNFQFKCKYQFVNAALRGDFEGKKNGESVEVKAKSLHFN